MIDGQFARMRTHRNNIQRYRHLLQSSLRELERQFVEKRLTEEQSHLERLAASLPFRTIQAGCAGPPVAFHAGRPGFGLCTVGFPDGFLGGFPGALGA
jgi:hypothetical protein